MPTQTLETSEQFLRTLAATAAAFLPNLVAALLILLAGFFLAGWLAGLVARALGASTRIDATVRAPLVAITRYLVVILTLVVALGQAGVEMTSLLAVLGAAGLAVGLALQGTLTNIAAGIMLLWLRPFRVGDYVETAAISGVVREIGLFVCHLETFDGLFVFAPNATLWNVWLRNHSRAATRLLAWHVTLPREVPFEEARRLLLEAFPEDGGARQLTGPAVFLDALTADAQVLVFQGRVREGAISDAQRGTAEAIRTLFVARFGAVGEPKAIARVLPADGDPSRFLAGRDAPAAHPALVGERPEGTGQGVAPTPAP